MEMETKLRRRYALLSLIIVTICICYQSLVGCAKAKDERGEVKKYVTAMKIMSDKLIPIESEASKIFVSCGRKQISKDAAGKKFSELQKQRDKILSAMMPKSIPNSMKKAHEYYLKAGEYYEKTKDMAYEYFKTGNDKFAKQYAYYLKESTIELDLFNKEAKRVLDSYNIKYR